MSRTEARKVEQLVAEMRSTLNLMRLSRKIPGSLLAISKQQCAQYLAKNILNYPPHLLAIGLRPGQTLQERKDLLSLGNSATELTEAEIEFDKLLEENQRKSLRSNWIWRIGQEARDKAQQGWYGFFVTLTVDPARVHDSEAMWKEGREFRKYLRRLARLSCKACGQPKAIKNGASIHDYVQHVGVIEHGKSNQHHHMHLLIWMRDIPASWKKCPNAGVKLPEHRTRDYCRQMSTYWPNSLPGIGRAKYFRHEGDIWSTMGFHLPYDPKKKRIIRIHSAEKAGLYIAKYMDKELKVWTHRVKATRNLGLNRLMTILRNLHIRPLEALSWRPRTYRLNISAQTIQTVPSALLRSKAKTELFYRRWASGQLDFKKLLNESCDAFTRMRQSVKDGARPKRMRSKAFYEWVSAHLDVPNGYCEARLERALHKIGAEFAPVHSQPITHTGMI